MYQCPIGRYGFVSKQIHGRDFLFSWSLEMGWFFTVPFGELSSMLRENGSSNVCSSRIVALVILLELIANCTSRELLLSLLTVVFLKKSRCEI